MKVLIFAGYFYPHKGGLEDYVYRLSKGLIKKGHEIAVVTTNSEKTLNFEIKDKIIIYRLDCWNFLNNKYPVPKLTIRNIKILRKIYNEKYNFVNTHTRFWISSGIGLMFSKLKKVPLVHVEHGTCHTQTDSLFISLINKLIDHTLGSLIVRNAKVRIGVSKSALDFMKHIGREGDIKISKGLELNKFKKKNNGLRKNLKINSKEIIIIGVGRLIYGKGFQDLITGFARLDKKIIKKSKLILIGDGDYRKELEELSKRLKINNKIIFLGEKNEDEIIKLLNITDIFVNPSYSEGMPTTVLEAGAVGIPVIATGVGGTKEIIINNSTGILIEQKNPSQVKEAIEFFIKNKKKKEEFARNLNNLIKKDYNYNNMINKFVEVYEGIR